MNARLKPKSLSYDIPNTDSWQIPDFVSFFTPYSNRIKANHQKIQSGMDEITSASYEAENRSLLRFLRQVLHSVPKIHAEAEVLSDLHFGLHYASDLEVLVYLHSIQPEFLFLNGDIIDQLVMQSRHDINPIQREAIRRIGSLQYSGECQVVRLRGNHDPMPDRKNGERGYAGIPVYRDVLFISQDGKRNFITHGDRFDKIVGSNSKLEKIGSIAYDQLVIFNHYHKKISQALGLEHWSLSRFCKATTKKICMEMSHYDDLVFEVADRLNANTVICGHTHILMHESRNSREYINSGDWVETCSALRKMPGQDWQLIQPMLCQKSRSYIHPKQDRHPAAANRATSLSEHIMQELEPVLVGRIFTDRVAVR